MMFVRVIFAAALAVTGTAVSAQDAAQPAPAQPVKEKKICRAETSTGSIMAKRVCRTKAEWSAINEQNERHTDAFRDRPHGTGGRGVE
jgi:hypothetical protein